MPGTSGVELADVRPAFGRAGERLAALLASVPDPSVRLADSDWSVGDVAAHVTLMAEAYAGFASGIAFADVSDIAGGSLARSNAARLSAEPDRDPATLAKRLTEGTAALLDATQQRSSDDRVVWNGHEITLGELLGIALGEYVVHGFDVARTTRLPWSIEPADARLVLASVLSLLPLLVDPKTASHVDATYDIHVRGGVRRTLRLRNGSGSVEAPGGRADCHVNADPVALLLVSYGRRSQWGPALTGKLLAWGAKPWLGLRLTRYLVAP